MNEQAEVVEDGEMPFVICRTSIKLSTIVLDGTTFTFDHVEELRTDLHSFEPTTIEDLATASFWLGELKIGRAHV